MSTHPDNTPESPDDPSPQAPAPEGAAVEYRELVLVKHGQRYIFRYTIGEEAKLLAGLTEMVRDPENGLDWFDAAVLSHQMGRNMGVHLARIGKRPPQTPAA